jgi:predicted transcriptional regulator
MQAMTTETKKPQRTILYATITREMDDALRFIAFKERRSKADIAREAIDQYIKKRESK